MVTRPVLPEPVEETLEEVAEENDYNRLGEAIRHVCREAGYDV